MRVTDRASSSSGPSPVSLRKRGTIKALTSALVSLAGRCKVYQRILYAHITRWGKAERRPRYEA